MLACSWIYILFIPKLEEYALLSFNDNILKFDISIFFRSVKVFIKWFFSVPL